MREELRLAGHGEDEIDRFLPVAAVDSEADEALFPILPENWPSLRVFLACDTKWQRNEMSGEVRGIDYLQAEVPMRAYRIKPSEREHVFDDLRAMERAALPLLNRGRE